MLPTIAMLVVAGAVGKGPVQEPDLSGRYVMTLHVASRARIPVLGWMPSQTISTVLVDLVRTGDHRYEQRHQVCTVDIESDRSQAKTTIPDAFVAALPVKTYQVELSAVEQGWGYTADLGDDHIGYDPSKSADVPQRAKDPAVTDPDGDGKPGMTVLVTVPLFGEGELYLVQRGRMRLAGAVVSDTTIEGQLEVVALEQRTLKATNPLFSLSPALEPMPDASWFRLERAAGATCAGIRGLAASNR